MFCISGNLPCMSQEIILTYGKSHDTPKIVFFVVRHNLCKPLKVAMRKSKWINIPTI